MSKNKMQQENLCLATKQTIDLLRTELFENEFFPDFEKWNNRLKSLKRDIDKIYWSI